MQKLAAEVASRSHALLQETFDCYVPDAPVLRDAQTFRSKAGELAQLGKDLGDQIEREVKSSRTTRRSSARRTRPGPPRRRRCASPRASSRSRP